MRKMVLGIVAAICGWIGWAEAPSTAKWIGGGDRNNLSDPANWECLSAGGVVLRDAIPEASTTLVSIEGDTSFNCPLDTAPIWKTLTIYSVKLTADCDWRGAGDFTTLVNANATIEMAGHKLQVKVPNGSTSRRINVNDASAKGAGGEFHLYVPTGATFINNGGYGSDNVVWYSGSLKFVKDGPGTYVPHFGTVTKTTGNRFYQYTGGTVIHEGLVDLPNDPEGTNNETWYSQSKRPMFGPTGGSAGGITVDAGASFNYKGIYDIGAYYKPFVLNGGTLSCDRAPAYPNYGGITDVQLTADSNFSFTRPAHVEGPWTLNGHTLAIDLASGATLYCRAGTIRNGTVKTTGEGSLRSAYVAIVATDNVTLDIGTPLDVNQPIAALNYIARYEGLLNAGTAAFTVSGRFTPITDSFYPVTLKHGATLDLSTRTGVWSTTGEFGTMKIEEDSAITIDIGERPFVNGEQLVAWDQIPASGCAFRIVNSTGANEAPRVDDTGVYVDFGDTSIVRVAHWTGAMGNGSFDDSGNWACTNSMGQGIIGVPGSEAVVYIRTVNFDLLNPAVLRAKLESYQAFYFDATLSLTKDCDWRGLDSDFDLLAGRTIALNGHRLTVAGYEGTNTLAFAATDVGENGGTLEIEVPEGVTFVNQGYGVHGTAKLEKTGPGTMVQRKYGNTFTGGTVISGGVLKLYNDDVADSSTWSPSHSGAGVLGPHGAAITICTGAAIDINGNYDLCNYRWKFAGGTMLNSKKQMKYSWGGFGNVELETDTDFEVGVNTVLYSSTSFPFDLKGHTMKVHFNGTGNYYFSSVVMSNGTLVVEGDGTFDVYRDFNSQNLTLDLSAEPLMNGMVSVSNLIMRHVGTYYYGENKFVVNGRFTPMVDHFRSTMLKDNAILDLSHQSGTMNTVTISGSLQFDPACSNIVIDVGARELESEAQIVAWPRIPEGVTFTLVGEKVRPGSNIVLVPTGIFYDMAEDSQLVVSATWTGNGEPNNIYDPENWACRNALDKPVMNGLPGKCARVVLNGHFGNVLAGTMEQSPWQQCVVQSGMLTEDCDLRAFGNYSDFFEEGSTIDLRGHRLFVIAPAGVLTKKYIFTDTSTDPEHPGQLHLQVPSGVTFTNGGTTMSGNLQFVKEGEGTMVPSLFKLDYYGGNVVAAGGIRLVNDTTADSTVYALGQNKNPNPLGRYNSAPVRIDSGAWVDVNGVYDTSLQCWQLNGGTVSSSKAMTKSSWGGFGNITLASNSTVNVGANFFINGNVDLGGNTLAVQIVSGGWFHLRSSSFKNGCLDAVSGGFLSFPAALDMRTVDLKAGAALAINGDVSVRDYYTKYNANASVGTMALNVYGTFTPNDNYFYGCTMQNGSTIDLSAKSEPWSVSSKNTKTVVTNVTFAAGAKVTVDLHGREFDFAGTNMVKVVSWGEMPPDTVRFQADPETRSRARNVIMMEDGLYVIRTSTVLIFR